MAGLDPNSSFTPAVTEAFGADNVIVVKHAQGGQPIRRWDKQWVATDGQNAKQIGDLYDQLMTKTREAIGDQPMQSVTFVWMQGERDAREQLADLYVDSFNRVVAQLKSDLGHDRINVVIGRLSDFDMNNETYPHWTRMRELQVSYADENSRVEWVDTDDLNDGVNKNGKTIKDDLHYSVDGYEEFGRRLADKAIGLIGK